MTPYLRKLFQDKPELEPIWREQLEDHPMLGQTTWTEGQVDALELRVDEHVDQCDECNARHDQVPPWPSKEWEEFNWDEFENCPIGESLMQEWLDASQEFSWQEDFPGQPQFTE